jgi:hypothetical protein
MESIQKLLTISSIVSLGTGAGTIFCYMLQHQGKFQDWRDIAFISAGAAIISSNYAFNYVNRRF